MRHTARMWNCLDCSAQVERRVKRCQPCNKAHQRLRLTYVRTPEHRAAMSLRLTGRKLDYLTGGSLPGVAEKIRQAWTPEMRDAAKLRGLALAADRAWRDLIAALVSGDLNPNFQGKNRATPYSPGWGRLHKELIRERAGHLCESCGKPPSYSSMRLDIHHIDRTKANHHPDNLQALCRKCHKAVHPSERQTVAPTSTAQD